MDAAIPVDRYRQLIADESIPLAHRTMWALLWETDLRRDDLLSMDVRDVDFDAGTAAVEFPKQGAPAPVPLGDVTLPMLRTLVAGRAEGPLLPDSDGRPFTVEAVTRRAREAGVSLHGFRLGGQLERAAA